MKDTSRILTFKIAALKTAIGSGVVAAALTPATLIHNHFFNPLSGERTPVLGDAQYEQLKKASEALLAQDKNLAALSQEIITLKQEKIAFPDKNIDDKTIAEKQEKLSTGIDAAAKDFNTLAVTMYQSHGISEKDAIDIMKPFEQSAYLRDKFTIQNNIEYRLRNLDECQIDAAHKIATTAEKDEIAHMNVCMNEVSDNRINLGREMTYVMGGLAGAMSGVITLLILLSTTGNTLVGLSTRRDRMREDEKAGKKDETKQLVINVVKKSP